jgi:hypothetical protein
LQKSPSITPSFTVERSTTISAELLAHYGCLRSLTPSARSRLPPLDEGQITTHYVVMGSIDHRRLSDGHGNFNRMPVLLKLWGKLWRGGDNEEDDGDFSSSTGTMSKRGRGRPYHGQGGPPRKQYKVETQMRTSVRRTMATFEKEDDGDYRSSTTTVDQE